MVVESFQLQSQRTFGIQGILMAGKRKGPKGRGRKSTMRQVSFRLSPKTIAGLDLVARDRGQTRTAMLRWLLMWFMNHREPVEAQEDEEITGGVRRRMV